MSCLIGCGGGRLESSDELSLGHLRSLCAGDLPFHLFTGPASGINGTPLKVPIRSSVLDQLRDPLRAVVFRIFSPGKGVCQIPAPMLVRQSLKRDRLAKYPMTPIADRKRASLRFGSCDTIFNNLKMDSTYCVNRWAGICQQLSMINEGLRTFSLLQREYDT